MKKLWKLGWELYRRHKEGIDYLFWGGIAFVLSMVLFELFANVMHMYEQIANTLDWIICVIFTYFTNRYFVFQSKAKGAAAVGKEFLGFVTARVTTLIMENVILFVMIDGMAINNRIAKLVGQAVVIISNYIFSKVWIFKK